MCGEHGIGRFGREVIKRIANEPKRPKQRWVNRIKIDLQILGVINGEKLANDRKA